MNSTQDYSTHGYSTRDSGAARVFFALWPEVLVRRALHTLATQYQSPCVARAMAEDSLHMTLLFVGEVERVSLPQLIQTANKISVPAFGLVLERLSFWLHNRIAYATLQAEVTSLSQLVATLRQEVLAAGFVFEIHEFTPHVTLLRGVGHALDSQAITPINWWVDSFVLVESFKVEQGSRYQVLQKWSLSA